MYLRGERFYFSPVRWVSKVRQRKGGRPNVLTVEINFRWSVNARVSDFESQQRRQRLRFDWKLKCSALLGLSVNPDCLWRERLSGAKKSLLGWLWVQRVAISLRSYWPKALCWQY